MPKKSTLQIVTANDLMEGDVIYLTAGGDWARDHAAAAVAATPEAADRLLATALAQPEKAVGPYLAEAEHGADGRPQPVHYRETIRTLGPTVRADLGKQAAIVRDGGL